MKYAFKKVLLLLLLLTFVEAEDRKKMIDAVNQQKVLLQQILKEYAFMGMGNSFNRSKNKLKENLTLYKQGFGVLEAVITDSKGKEALANSDKIWESIKEDLYAKPVKKNVANLQKKTDKILQEMSTVMRGLLSKDKKDKNSIVNIAGYQGVIIERMAALYMLKTWGISDPKFNFKMRESITFFNNSLYKMLESKETTPRNMLRIKKVMRSFKFFEVMNRSKTKFIPTLIYAKTKRIHHEINTITQAYIKKGK